MLATYSLLPIIQAFTAAAGVRVETRDISLAGRILAVFADQLPAEQQVSDDLAELGELAKSPAANIIKLPNISASIPQMKAAIRELQSQGYALPDYPDEPANDLEKDIRARYDRVKGSAVNPVLREGNSDRRAAPSVKNYARQHPHSMGAWAQDSRSHVASMEAGDFYGSERSVTVTKPTAAKIEFVPQRGEPVVLRSNLQLQAGEIVDAAVMSRRALREFYAREVEQAKAQGVLFSLHLKSTMMKVSDPILFGHAVEVFFEPVFSRYAETFRRIGFKARDGLGDLYQRLAGLPEAERAEIEAALQECLTVRPPLAMVNSDKGITNLHVPSDVIIDASMPAAIRDGGKMWNPAGKLQDMKAVIPDRCYAGVYAETIRFCRENGAFDPATMGSVPNVGLMAQKAEEYGSHDKTFEMTAAGVVRVMAADGSLLLEQPVEEGDIFRACQTRDAPVRNWVELAVRRGRASGVPVVFWLDRQRAHDAQVLLKVEETLASMDTGSLEIHIMAPVEAARFTLERAKAGLDTISVTGNVLRDYLTDLFPILELGTSAKMLSIVPLMNGGGLFETGAGGSAPKHVQQLLEENHLRWDSLGEFLALGVSLEHLAERFANPQAQVLANTLDRAIARFLELNKSPSRKPGRIGNRGSHFFLALYWAEALAAQEEDAGLRGKFSALARELQAEATAIEGEMVAVQGRPTDIGGYYRPDPVKAARVMRPSATFNRIMETFAGSLV